MTIYIEDKDRKLIPRWRDSLKTMILGELEPIGKIKPKQIPNHEFHNKKLKDWQENPTLDFAIDLVSSAYIIGFENDAIDAAKFILEKKSEISDSVIKIANKILNKNNENLHILDESLMVSKNDLYKRIHKLKSRLIDIPRNALAWVDIARKYEILGQKDKASRAMKIGLIIAPSNRFILRSASRMYIHHDDYDLAYNVFRKQESVKIDPWLLSAEISAASISGCTSRLIKYGHRILKSDNYEPSQISELSSALATLELETGNIRKARKLFRQSLISPSDNTIAQIVWASKHVGSIIDPKYFQIPFTFEARANDYFNS